MTKVYSMRDADAVGRLASKAVTRWLKRHPDTRKVANVEAAPEYQAKDIDLLWHTRDGLITIEVKGDRYTDTGNFFFETVSNREAGTPGCFLYTEADFVYYFFVGSAQLYILPMPATRDWFNANLSGFKEVSTRTAVAGGAYTTVGRLVPIHRVLREVREARHVNLQVELFRTRTGLPAPLAGVLKVLKDWLGTTS